ncbi:CNH-domain-containing protein [Pluteus cervinus]|uniref:CNH-domain-containing protein n=1 Tax=Pluteus cervinus TaxID=181527 RepID=A0ACD3BA12_9AGAR|nr:CNH-domain-containing protein [Pluteus cervinus]
MTRLGGDALSSVRSIAQKMRLKSPGKAKTSPNNGAYAQLDDSLPRTSTSSYYSCYRTSEELDFNPMSSVIPLPYELTDQIPTEIYERIIDFLHTEQNALSGCSLVCKAWHASSRLHLFDLYVKPKPISRDMGMDIKRVNCAVYLRRKHAILYGMDDGIYFGAALVVDKPPTKVMNIPNVQQMDILMSGTLVVFRAGRDVYSVPLSALQVHSGNVFEASICQKVTSNAHLFNVGKSAGREMMCVVKAGTLSSTCKLFHPQNSADKPEMALFKVFYLPQAASSVQFHKNFVILATNGVCHRGFEVIDLQNYTAQGILDPTDPRLEFVRNAKCLAFRKVGKEFLLCYDQFAFYINTTGHLARDNKIYWEYPPREVVFHEDHMIGVSDKGLEIRNVVTGQLVQTIQLDGIRMLSGVTSSLMITARENGWVDGLEFSPRKA